jgi:hypothetical protein
MDHNLITVVIPTIPPRGQVLQEALFSVKQQVLRSHEVLVEMDTAHAGAAITRQRGLERVTTPWVAFLDDDDMFMPQHLNNLWRHARETGADYVYSWFETMPVGCDPFPVTHFTAPWDPAAPRQTTITTLVKTSLAQEVGFLGESEDTQDGMRSGEDWGFTLGCNKLGTISHLVERTWFWRHWGQGSPGMSGNTSGLGSRW